MTLTCRDLVQQLLNNEVLIKMSYQARNRHLLSYNERQVNFYQFSKLMNIDRLLFEVH